MSEKNEQFERAHFRLPSTLLGRMDEEIRTSGFWRSRNMITVKALENFLAETDEQMEATKALQKNQIRLEETTEKLAKIEEELENLKTTLENVLSAKFDEKIAQAIRQLAVKDI